MNNQRNKPRAGCSDIWNAFMVEGASFVLGSDMPVCHQTSSEIPKRLISYVEAKHIYKIKIQQEPDFKYDAYVHFYIDDQKFDGKQSSIWLYPEKALNILCHFSGVISPDFSTYQDFPDALKRYNIYRMRTFDYWLSSKGIPIIFNVRWNTIETWDYCFDGIPLHSIVCIGTVASGINRLENRPDFVAGLKRMVEILQPSVILCYGSARYTFFDEVVASEIPVISFPSETNLAFKGVKSNE
ncbi:MAG: DUF4417 domain-containing protein [Lachnospiraceae bacterium]|nr:DUF4417 domain-containing protein [Lachnospiraceae bacterium]